METTILTVNNVWMMICTALVFFMHLGFSFLEIGLTRQKNTINILFKNFFVISVGLLLYCIGGFNLMYPGFDEGDVGILKFAGFGISAPEGGMGFGYADGGYTWWTDFLFQGMFAATAATIVSGAVAERIKISGFMLFAILYVGLVYPIVGAWKWGGGFLDAAGFLDFAGSTVVHSVGGWAALMGAIILGPRLGKYGEDGTVNPILGSNLALATLGTFILWLGWFGFNGGSQLAMGSIGDISDVSRIFVNTNMAAASGAIIAAILTQVSYGKVDLTMVLNGALAGLVSITAEPLTPTLGWSMIIGGIGGAIVVYGVPLLDRFKIDDVVGAIPVHLFAGIWGTIAVVLTNSDASLGTQIYSIVVVGLFVSIASGIVWLILKAAMGIRVSAEDEVAGLDQSELGMEAYPDFSKSS